MTRAEDRSGKKLKELKKGSGRPKRLLADTAFDKAMLRAITKGNSWPHNESGTRWMPASIGSAIRVIADNKGHVVGRSDHAPREIGLALLEELICCSK